MLALDTQWATPRGRHFCQVSVPSELITAGGLTPVLCRFSLMYALLDRFGLPSPTFSLFGSWPELHLTYLQCGTMIGRWFASWWCFNDDMGAVDRQPITCTMGHMDYKFGSQFHVAFNRILAWWGRDQIFYLIKHLRELRMKNKDTSVTYGTIIRIYTHEPIW